METRQSTSEVIPPIPPLQSRPFYRRWLVVGVLILTISIIVSLLVYKNYQLRQEVNNSSTNTSYLYYENLKQQCQGRQSRECCLSAVATMETSGFKVAEGEMCPEGYMKNTMLCIDSYTWCEPVLKFTPTVHNGDNAYNFDFVIQNTESLLNQKIKISAKAAKLGFACTKIGCPQNVPCNSCSGSLVLVNLSTPLTSVQTYGWEDQFHTEHTEEYLSLKSANINQEKLGCNGNESNLTCTPLKAGKNYIVEGILIKEDDRFYLEYLSHHENTSNKEICENEMNGKWLEEFKECEFATAADLDNKKVICTQASGMFDECTSACRHVESFSRGETTCTTQCIPVCSFN